MQPERIPPPIDDESARVLLHPGYIASLCGVPVPAVVEYLHGAHSLIACGAMVLHLLTIMMPNLVYKDPCVTHCCIHIALVLLARNDYGVAW